MLYAEIDATFHFDSVQLVSVVHFGRGNTAESLTKYFFDVKRKLLLNFYFLMKCRRE